MSQFNVVVRINHVSPYLQQVDSKVRCVMWTHFQNKLCSERLHMDGMDLCTGLYRVGISNDTPVNEFSLTQLYFVSFLSSFSSKRM